MESPSSALSGGLSNSRFSPADVDQLEEELSMQRAILASLHDLPDSVSKEEEIKAVKTEIIKIQRRLAQARNKGLSTSTSMDRNQAYWPRGGSSFASSSSGTPQPGSSTTTPGGRQGPFGSLGQRKRYLEDAHLDIDASSRGSSKSRRTSRSPGLRAPSSASHSSFDDPIDVEIIDLTGDDDEWRTTLMRQQEAMAEAARRKAAQDRDAALARQLEGRRSPSPAGPASAPPSWPAPSTNGSLGHWRNPAAPSPPLTSSQSGPASLPRAASQGRVNGPSSSWQPTLPSFSRLPGISAIKSEATPKVEPLEPAPRPTPSSTNPWSAIQSSEAPSLPKAPSFPSLPTTSARPFQPTLPLPVPHSTSPTSGFTGPPLPPRFGVPSWPNLPGAPNTGYPASWSSQMLQGPSRPGYVTNGSYYASSSQPVAPSTLSLAETISRVNGYDFDTMLDQNGNPFNQRLRNILFDNMDDDAVDTKEEIKQLLSNIRPDVDVPEMERGETPEAMKYPLYPHQQLALKWMTDMEEGTNKGGILADEMGLGKTISTLSLIVSRQASSGVKACNTPRQWELEIKNKLKTSHRLSVLLLHSKKRTYRELKEYDVVLTTYGLLASEWRRYQNHVAQRKESARYREEEDAELARICPLIHPRSKFHRIILDEAQCINNKDTQASRAAHQINATYRWCLTGTPMMNGVSELFSLIRFLRIRPYNNFTTFQRDFRCLTPRGNKNDSTRQTAMRKLQAVLKAMMLRRTKTSTIDGEPILRLPPKTEHSQNIVFSDDERAFYRALESRSQVLFNKYVRAGTVGKNYSSILVLLLRLRQACCHPHLTEFDATAADAASDDHMIDLAKSLDQAVVERIKTIEAFECPICYDGVQDPVLAVPCGHDTCTECFASLTETSAQRNFGGDEGGPVAKCPVCRGPVDPAKVITLTAFRKVHAPELIEQAEDAAADGSEDDSDSDESSTYDEIEGEESDADDDGNLAGFVVPDDVDDGDLDDDAIDAEIGAAAQVLLAKKAPNPEGSSKSIKKEKIKKENKDKGKKRDKKDKSRRKSKTSTPADLKVLRAEADKNKEARRVYMRYLRDNWQDSAKVTEVINLLREVRDDTDEKAIVFSQWTGLLDLIECQIKDKLPGLHYCRYTGKMSRVQRDEAVQSFTSDPRARVLLVSLRAGNSGLNLTAASRVIVCDPSWNPFIEAQAVDRAHRIGQRREVKVHRLLVEGTVEDRILALQESKRGLVEAALDEGGSRSVGRLSERELAYLFGVGVGPGPNGR
ncbi:hypothetical protein VTJ49DRAFT_3979 [Mycothermus thermophilus]|uniref:Uncharacterized protein n=1 Tax=Humicola insolens TaxID=85995 RepID=A0ABR3V6K4_HUMIN